MADPRSERTAELIRGLSFGSITDQHERYRLDYPDELGQTGAMVHLTHDA